MNRAKIGANSLIGAGSLVTEGKEFPPGSLIMGTPARVKRALTDEEIASMCTFPADDYVRQSGEMLEQGVLEHPAPDMDMHRGALGQSLFPLMKKGCPKAALLVSRS